MNFAPKNALWYLCVTARKLAVVLLILIASLTMVFLLPSEALAAEVTLTTSAEPDYRYHNYLGSQTVFIDDQTGYRFFVDSARECSYVKTTNGGDSWGSLVKVDDQGTQTDCFTISVHYDKWTPGDTGDFIHIATADTSSDDIFYNRLDTTDDSLLVGSTAINATQNAGYAGTLSQGANILSISKSTTGEIFTGIADASDSIVVSCSASCGLSTSWSEVGVSPQDNVNDWGLLMPLPGGDMMMIYRDLSTNDVLSKVWDASGSAWDASWTTIDNNAAENTVYDGGLDAVVDNDTGDIYLAYLAENNVIGTNDDIRTAVYSGGTWTNKTDMVTNSSRGLVTMAIGMNANNSDVYVVYTGRSDIADASTADVYWNISTDGMNSWGTETGPINSISGDLSSVSLNEYSDERLYASWFDGGSFIGDTIADVFGGIIATTTGAHISEVRASTTDFYTGGSFVLIESVDTSEVTSVTISATGTLNTATDIENVRLYYENDTSAPYDCQSESYGGGEAQYGSTVASGFSVASGTATFTDTGILTGTSSALCLYPVVDIVSGAQDTGTFQLFIEDPSVDVVRAVNSKVVPDTTIAPTGNVTVRDSVVSLDHFHFRNDDGLETDATSKTGGVEDERLPSLSKNNPFRLRLGISNNGSTSTLPSAYTLEYSSPAGTCAEADTWLDVDAVNDDINLSNTANLTDGANTTDIATSTGGVTNGNTSFLSANTGVRDATSQTNSLVLSPTNFTEFEYSLIASTSAPEGNTYCFRLSSNNDLIDTYSVYPRVTIAADSTAFATGTQATSFNIPSTNQYIGATFAIKDESATRTVSSITITEDGTVDAQNNLDNISLFFEYDTTVPLDCDSESYGGGEAQFGATDTDGFSGPNGSSTFSGSATISLTQTACFYAVLDVVDTAFNGQTIDLFIADPPNDLTVSGGGSIAPTASVILSGTTVLNGPEIHQTGFHFRDNSGDEAGAISATAGIQDTNLNNQKILNNIRLRMQLSNEGNNVSKSFQPRLEYGTKITECSNVGAWAPVETSGTAFTLANIANLTQGDDTTDVDVADGGISNPVGKTLLPSNGGQNDTTATSASSILTPSQFTEVEYSLQISSVALNEATYCFRLSNAGTNFDNYVTYPEVTIEPKQDFLIQRGSTTVSGTSATITAGVDYDAPSSASSAFIRITNSHHTGAGRDFSGGNQNTNDVSVYISNPENITTSIDFARAGVAPVNNSQVFWEIVEYIGQSEGDNEMIVRDAGVASYGTADTATSGPVASGVVDDNDVVVFITGQQSDDITRNDYETLQSTSEWASSTQQPQFQRGAANGSAGNVSYVVVEFTGVNWRVDRVEHSYSSAGADEEEEIVPALTSVDRAFLHTQKRILNGLSTVANFGHEVWISSAGFLTFKIQSGATDPPSHTSVAWVIENLQNTAGAMNVRQVSGETTVGTEPLFLNVGFGGGNLEKLSQTSLFFNTANNNTGTNHPRGIAGFILEDLSSFNIWRSDTGNTLFYRGEIVEWPTAELAYRQNYYQIYVDNDTLTPTDPWPVGAQDIGENAALTVNDEPVAEGERVRIRMSLRVANANMPELVESFKLQFAERVSTCSAIATWSDMGNSASTTVWRGYDGTPADGDALPSTILSVSDVAGTYEEANNSAVNPSTALVGEDVEYDWVVEQNGAVQRTNYCFRMVFADGSPLSIYNNYPTIRSSGYTPVISNWRWYTDENNLTPTDALAGENVSPSGVDGFDVLKLRMSLRETENADGENVKFALQYSQSPTFADGGTFLTSTSSCTSTSTWCYADVAGEDSELIDNAVISDSDPCVSSVGAGCGTYNEASTSSSTVTHNGFDTQEYEFGIVQRQTRVNSVYYFRLYNPSVMEFISASTSYPSLTTAVGSLSFTVSGVESGTTTEGFVTTSSTTPTDLNLNVDTLDTVLYSAHRLTTDTNAPEGYQVLFYSDQLLTDSSGNFIDPITGSNASPVSWNSGCSALADSCFGYHVGDDVLAGGSTRFAPNDSFAPLPLTPEEVMYSALPSNDTEDIVYAIRVDNTVPAGDYQSTITYIVVPVY